MSASGGDDPPLTAVRAADVLYVVLGPELFLILTGRCGWSPDAWEGWATDVRAAQLLDEDATAGQFGR